MHKPLVESLGLIHEGLCQSLYVLCLSSRIFSCKSMDILVQVWCCNLSDSVRLNGEHFKEVSNNAEVLLSETLFLCALHVIVYKPYLCIIYL